MIHVLVLLPALPLLVAVFLACQAEPDYNFAQQGNASYYANLLKGHPTASGTLYHPDSLTAAHRYLPLGTQIMVINLKNNRQIKVTVNDRGPFHSRRILDLSRSAADSLGFRQAGVAEIIIKAVLSEKVLEELHFLNQDNKKP